MPRARPTTTAAAAALAGGPRHNSTTMDSGLSSAYSSAYSSAQSSAYSSLANTPRELSQAEARDAARDHRLAPSGRDHLSAVQHGARLPRRHEKRNRELKGRPRVRRTAAASERFWRFRQRVRQLARLAGGIATPSPRVRGQVRRLARRAL